nr:Pr6Pr family membrane protein [Microbacterium bovistercoris]
MSRPSGTFATVWTALRLVLAVAILVAVIAQFTTSMSTSAERGRDLATTAANFFSFFTILSNVAAAIVLLWAAAWYWTRGKSATQEPNGLALALACVSTYMIVTGVVYNVLLRGITLPQGSEPIPWSNEILHLIAPLFLLLDVLLGARRRSLRRRALFVIAAFPIAWAVYTLVRGPLTTSPVTGDGWWYPYPFLDPHNFANGYGTVALYIVAIAIVIVGVGAAVVWTGRKRAARVRHPASL